MAQDQDGPVCGAWPLATAEAYKDWVDRVMGVDWTSGQFACVEVVGLTNHQLAADQQTYRDWFGMDLNPVPYWFAPRVEEMDGVKWIWEQEGMGRARGWAGVELSVRELASLRPYVAVSGGRPACAVLGKVA